MTETTLAKKLEETFSFFEFATMGNSPLLHFEIDGNWMSVYYRETLTAEGTEWKWSLVCSQSIVDYAVCSGVFPDKVVETIKTKQLVNRITLMLAERLRSIKQDQNILTSEYVLTKK